MGSLQVWGERELWVSSTGRPKCPNVLCKKSTKKLNYLMNSAYIRRGSTEWGYDNARWVKVGYYCKYCKTFIPLPSV